MESVLPLFRPGLCLTAHGMELIRKDQTSDVKLGIVCGQETHPIAKMAVSLLKPVGCSENLSEPTTLVVGSANNTLKRINTYVIDQKGDSVMIAATFLSTCHGTYLQISGTLNWKVSLFIYLFTYVWLVLFCFGEAERSSISWFIVQMAPMTKAGPGWSQLLGFPNG